MKKFHKLAASLCAAFVLLISFSTVAYAGGGEETTEAVTESAVETEAEANPFTPAGTGTVIDTATDEDGKEFYTIMTPDENVFYLIIDRQRETENVYFLNTVTERDLLALAEKSEDTEENTVSAIPDNTTPAVTEPEAETPTEPETASSGNGGIIVVVLIVLAAGGAGYYFKIYRPKQQQADGEDEYEYEANEDGDDYGDYEDTEPEDDTPSWDEEYSGDGEE